MHFYSICAPVFICFCFFNLIPFLFNYPIKILQHRSEQLLTSKHVNCRRRIQISDFKLSALLLFHCKVNHILVDFLYFLRSIKEYSYSGKQSELLNGLLEAVENIDVDVCEELMVEWEKLL